MASRRVAYGLLAAIAGIAILSWSMVSKPGWTHAEAAQIASLSLAALPPLPPDRSNSVADQPKAAALGTALFKDARLSGDGMVSCASCHLPDRQFQDSVLPGQGVGRTVRRTMPIAGTGQGPWFFWDGRKDSQWSQALGPLENPDEHATDRLAVVHVVARFYRPDYEAIFGPLPNLADLPEHAAPTGSPAATLAWNALSVGQRDEINRAFANIGKAIAAFERTLLLAPTRFDAYAEAVVARADTAGLFSDSELAGLRVFLGKANCTQCHNGPLFSDGHFHNTGVPEAPGLPRDLGRAEAIAMVREDIFNCLGPYSDATPDDCGELRFLAEGDVMQRAFKTPSLRGAATRGPYMHAGQLATLKQVLDHYNTAPWAPIGVSELHKPALSADELLALEAFLNTL
jgi:cytochrome c peroxidase